MKLNSYILMSAWENWVYENSLLNKPHLHALFLRALIQNNKTGWSYDFGLARYDTMEFTGVSSRNTYSKSFDALVDAGVFTLTQKSKNQHTANRISFVPFCQKYSNVACSNNEQPQVQATDNNTSADTTACSNNEQPQVQAQVQPQVPAGVPYKTKETTKPKTKKSKTIDSSFDESETVFSFINFWDTYNKKVGSKKSCEKKYNKLSEEIRAKIKDHVPKYVDSTPDKQYRRNPETYLNQQGWNDEIIESEDSKKDSDAVYSPINDKTKISHSAFLNMLSKEDGKIVEFAMLEKNEFMENYMIIHQSEDFQMVVSLLMEEIEESSKRVYQWYCKKRATVEGVFNQELYNSFIKGCLQEEMQIQRIVKAKKYIGHKNLNNGISQ